MDPAGWIGLAGLVTALLGGIAGIIAAIARRATDAESAEDTAIRQVGEERTALAAEYRSLLSEFRTNRDTDEARHARELTAVNDRLTKIETELVAARMGHRACEEALSTTRLRREALEQRLLVAERRLEELGTT